jgi:hypothetical protein
MELTHENVSAWFDKYYEIIAKVGTLETVPTIGKYFTDDFEYVYYTLPPDADFTSSRASREELLMMFMHPGLFEVIKPEYYVIDLKQMIVAVHFYDQLTSASAGVLGSFHAAAFYHLVPAEDTGLKIRKLYYWTETQTPESVTIQKEAWLKALQEASTSVIFDWLKSRY